MAPSSRPRAVPTSAPDRAIKRLLTDIGLFSQHLLGKPLRTYQLEPARAILESVLQRRGRTFSVMMARQAGKNELSAQLEVFLLNLFQRVGGTIVKAAPTFRPQARISMRRLMGALDNPWNRGRARVTDSHIIGLGKAQVAFLSAAESANVVGSTASLLLEIDEAQDVSPAKFDRDFRPMGATTNVTTVLYGTAWTHDTLLERTRNLHLAQEAEDGVRRHFEYAWEEVAAHNPDYRRYVEAEVARLGVDHPLIQTQYQLKSLGASGGLLSEMQLALLQGEHVRQRRPEPGAMYVAGLDVAGADEQREAELLEPSGARRDSTVLTICEARWETVGDAIEEPRLRVVDQASWIDVPHRQLYERLLGLLREHWHCRRVVVDATGVGAGLAGFLAAALGRQVVEPFQFTTASKSELGYALLGAVNGGRLRMYVDDGSVEWRECFAQARAAQSALGPHQRLSFFVPPSRGHDDYLISLALAVRAARETPIRRAAVRQERVR